MPYAGALVGALVGVLALPRMGGGALHHYIEEIAPAQNRNKGFRV